MTKRIFRAILSVAAAILAACFLIILGVLYTYFNGISAAQLRTQTGLVAQGLSHEGAAYFDGLDTGSYRVTWIDAGGAVLYDTESDPADMESHADREEFREAAETGLGESARYSVTLTERMLYCAARLPDGSVVRVASAQHTILTLVLGMLQPLILVLVLAIVLSALLASRLAKRIVRPLNELRLDAPLENEAYEELSPLLTRIEHQKRQIAAQLEELRRKQEEWDTVTGSTGEGIVLLNENNAVLSINRSALSLLRADKGCVGQDFLTVCRRLDVQALLEKAAVGDTAETTLPLDGRIYQVNASPVLSGGEVKGTALLFFDVTEKAQTEQLRREFTANVSHELKTPLHTISGSAEIMKNGLVAAEDMPRFLDRIYTESQRMITLVDDIIRLSRLDEGAGDGPRERLSLKALAEDAAERLRPQADLRQISLSVSGDPGQITGITPLVAELVDNLCDNAVKYNRPGGSVQLQVADEPGEAVLTVADTGIGIPAEDRDRVFERFFRVDKSHSKEIGGTGLGLSIVKHVARLHQAKVELHSELGAGTTVTVRFPK